MIFRMDHFLSSLSAGLDAVEGELLGATTNHGKRLAILCMAMGRHLGGEDEAFRKEFRRRLLSLDGDQVRGAAARVFAGMESAPVCVLSSRERLLEENRGGGEAFAIESLWEERPAGR